MTQLIVLGHATFASGLKSSLEMITGNHREIVALDFNEDDSLEQYQINVKTLIETAREEATSFMVAVDLIGGTPFLTAAQFLNENDILVTGINLPSALEYVLSKEIVMVEPSLYKPKSHHFDEVEEGGI